jgi:hypothetical protein
LHCPSCFDLQLMLTPLVSSTFSFNSITFDVICPSIGTNWPLLLWSIGSWISNYKCKQCLSLLTLWVRIQLRRGVFDTTLYDKVVSDLRQVGGFIFPRDRKPLSNLAILCGYFGCLPLNYIFFLQWKWQFINLICVYIIHKTSIPLLLWKCVFI